MMSQKRNSVEEDHRQRIKELKNSRPHKMVVKEEPILDDFKVEPMPVVVKEEPDFDDWMVMEEEPIPDVVKEEPILGVVKKEPIFDVMKEPIPDVVKKEPTPDVVKKEPIFDVVKKEPVLDVVKKEPILDVVKREPILDVVKKEETIGNDQCNNERLLIVKKQNQDASEEKPGIKEDIIKCEVCGIHCRYRSQLKKHLRFHRNECPYKCLVCEKGFFTTQSFVDHDKMHVGNRPFKCVECRTALYSANLQIQERKQATEKSFEFDKLERGFVCFCAFKRYQGNRKHGKVICEVCKKAYSYSANFIHGLGKHTSRCMLAKPFKCNMCVEGFDSYSSLMQHKGKHKETKPFMN